MKVLGFRVSGLRVPVLRLGGLGPRRWLFVQDLARGACPDRRIWIFASKHCSIGLGFVTTLLV